VFSNVNLYDLVVSSVKIFEKTGFKITPNGEAQFYDTLGENMERSIDVSL
jgi:hypothetical protein